MVDGVKKKKKQKSQGSVYVGEDRISGLPDSLIHHIFSFLTMKKVVRTSMLSRRWRYVWTSVPVLDFGLWWPAEPAFIDRSLMLYEGRKIQRFHVDVDCKVDAGRMDSWIRFAVRRDVEELDIQSFYHDDGAGSKNLYRVPSCVLDCAELRVLRLRIRDQTLPSSFCFRSLTELHLCHVDLNDLDTSGCPLLEKLIIQGRTKSLKIYAPNQQLKLLKIDDNSDMLGKDCALTLYAPYLLSIEFSGYLGRIYNLKNLSHIKRATVYFTRVDGYVVGPDHAQSLVELLKILSHAKTLKLSQKCIEIFYYRERNNLERPPLSATCLELATSLSKSQLVGIVSLLRSSRCYETLVITICYSVYGVSHLVDEIKSSELLELALSANLQIKTVIIRSFLGSEYDLLRRKPEPGRNMDKFLENWAGEIKLVGLLLKGCKMLDKMIIRTIEIPLRPLKSELLLGLTKKLLAFPRASVNAEIYFS